MSENRTVSITLPSDVLSRVETLALQQNLSVDELIQSALARYDRERWWDQINAYGGERAETAGVRSDEDIVAAIHELRAGLRSQEAGSANHDRRP
jgi:predicted transcriptional regulator